MQDLNALMSALGNIAQVDPNLITLYVKTEDLPTYIFGQTGAPAKLLRTEKETKEVQQQMAEQQQAAALLQAK